MLTLERARAAKVTWVSLVGLILVPLLVAAGFLWATWDSTSRLDRVQAAIVNNDEGTTIDGQTVPLGRQLAGGLVNGAEDVSNFDWVLTDTEDGSAGLAAGTYAAVVTIPEDFSAGPPRSPRPTWPTSPRPRSRCRPPRSRASPTA